MDSVHITPTATFQGIKTVGLRVGSGFVWDIPDSTGDPAKDSSESDDEEEAKVILTDNFYPMFMGQVSV